MTAKSRWVIGRHTPLVSRWLLDFSCDYLDFSQPIKTSGGMLGNVGTEGL